MQINVPVKQSECLYDTLDEGEAVTASMYVLSGKELKATMSLEGPVAPAGIDSGMALLEHVQTFQMKGAYNGDQDKSKITRIENIVDFEHLSLADTFAQEEEAAARKLALHKEFAESELEFEGKPDSELTLEQRKKRKDMRRKKALEQRQREEQQRLSQHRKIRDEGQPFQQTIVAKEAGWFRFCVTGSYYQVTAEVEMRKESELGGINEEDGHVLTYEEKDVYEEELALEEDTPEEEGIKDEDFQSTRTKLRTLRRLLAEIHSRQQKERHRLIIHSATNEHSHSRMVLSSLLETCLFMAVTGFQVYTIRRWFKGAPVLGR